MVLNNQEKEETQVNQISNDEENITTEIEEIKSCENTKIFLMNSQQNGWSCRKKSRKIDAIRQKV